MKKSILAIIVVAFVFITGCKKSTDQAAAWVGTYNGNTVGAGINRVIITEVNSNTLQMQLQTYLYGSYYTYTTLKHATLATATSVAVNETDSITSYPGIWSISGGGTLSGDSLTLSGTATQSGQSPLYYSFSGSK